MPTSRVAIHTKGDTWARHGARSITMQVSGQRSQDVSGSPVGHRRMGDFSHNDAQIGRMGVGDDSSCMCIAEAWCWIRANKMVAINNSKGPHELKVARDWRLRWLFIKHAALWMLQFGDACLGPRYCNCNCNWLDCRVYSKLAKSCWKLSRGSPGESSPNPGTPQLIILGFTHANRPHSLSIASQSCSS